MGNKIQFRHSILAIVYDFDGTLTPKPMQDYTVLPAMGIDPREFWRRADRESVKTHGESILTYMRLLIEESQKRDFKFTSSNLEALARKIQFFPGVSSYFQRINGYIRRQFKNEVTVRHYIISAGLKEIIAATPIAKFFHNIFASLPVEIKNCIPNKKKNTKPNQCEKSRYFYFIFILPQIAWKRVF